MLASLALSLAAAEGLYRWRSASSPDGGDDGWYTRYRHMNETIYQRSSDAALLYEPTPSSAVEMEYGMAGFNAQGLREAADTSLAPIEGRTRVVVLGDSIVWSEYLAVHDAIPTRAGEALGAGYEVLNAGVTGYDTTQEARFYEVALRPLRPAVLVLVFCMNDLMIMSGPYGRFATDEEEAIKDAQDAMFAERAPVRRETLDEVIDRRERESSFRLLARALGMWERWRFESSYLDEYLILAEDEARWQRFSAALDRLGDALREDGVTPVLVISPVLERWDDYRWSELHARVRAAAEAAGFSVSDPLDAWRTAHAADRLRMGSDNLHYGRTGARVMGEAIADAVREAR